MTHLALKSLTQDNFLSINVQSAMVGVEPQNPLVSLCNIFFLFSCIIAVILTRSTMLKIYRIGKQACFEYHSVQAEFTVR